MKEQLYSILEKLIIKNNIHIDKDELKLQLSSHPSYPSLHAVTGVLDHFNIPNLALQLSTNVEMLESLPTYFLANIKDDRGEKLILVKKEKKQIKILSNKTKTISHDTFIEQWDGIILVIEKDENSYVAPTNIVSNISRWMMYASIIFMFAYIIYASNQGFVLAHFILSALGVFISIYIVKHELGLQTSATNSFCNISSKTSCDAVLDSKGALIFGTFKLSDLSLVIFSGYCLCWGVYTINEISNVSTMSIVTLLAFPFMVYSIYYQYQVVKKWCPLCLSISAVLMLQIIAVFISKTSVNLTVSYKSILILVISMLLLAGIWGFLKPLLVKKHTLSKLQVEHYKFKRNFSLFKALFHEEEKLPLVNYFPEELVFGNHKAPLELLLVTSPLCFYCKSAHKDIEKLLQKSEGKIKIIIRFNINANNKESVLYRVISRLYDVYHTHGESSALKVLHEIYSDNINLEDWLANQTQTLNKSYDYTLDEQHNWCMSNSVNFTPALYINNRPFPKAYERVDLIYFIDDLIELDENSQSTSLVKQPIAS